jgi:hypothetical protein
MTAPDIDTLDTFGGALQDYAPAVDPTTDRSAATDNLLYADVAAMTHTAARCWLAFTAAATTGAMSLVAYDSMWNVKTPTVPVFAHTATGTFTFTWPGSVADEIPNGKPGYNASGHTLNLRSGRHNCRSATTAYFCNVVVSANVVTVYVFLGSTAALNDAVGVVFDIWAF